MRHAERASALALAAVAAVSLPFHAVAQQQVLASADVERVAATWQRPEVTGRAYPLGVTFDGVRQVEVDDAVPKGVSPAGLAWVSTGGPRGGIGYDIRIHPRDPNVLWVTDANAGAHQSVDGGRTWTPRNEGITARSGVSGDSVPIFCLTIDGNAPDTIWVGTQGVKGVFLSDDGGAHWIERDQGIANQLNTEIRSFTVDPRNSSVVYCGGNYLADTVNVRQRGFIYKSTDRGATWTLLHEPGALVRWIIIDPTNSDIVYAATGIFDRWATKPEGVLKSTDGGRTWRNVNDGLTNLVVGALAMSPGDSKVLIAGTGKTPAFLDAPDEHRGAVFKSTDGGAHWRKVYPPGDEYGLFSAVAFAPSNPSIVYADTGPYVVRSADAGETWTLLPARPEGESRGNPIALAVHPNDPDIIFMNAYGGGVFVSRDGAKSWQDSSAGVTGEQVWGLAVSESDPLVIAAAKNGVYLSARPGAPWQGRSADGIDNMTSIAVHPTSSSTWLAGRQLDGTIWRTSDAGRTWRTVLPPLGDASNFHEGLRSVHRVVFAPSAPTTVYAATGIAPEWVFHHIRGPGVYRSTDGGLTWAPCNRGLEETSLNVLALAVHPLDPRVVYVGLLDDGVHKSVDGGESWLPANAGLAGAEVRALAIDPGNPSLVFAGLERGGLWRSLDGGASWRQSSVGMPAEASVRAIAVDRSMPGVAYAADYGSGVYRTTDGGSTWSVVNAGLRNRAVAALALTPDGHRLFAGTDGAGVFRLDLPKGYVTGLDDPIDEKPRSIRP